MAAKRVELRDDIFGEIAWFRNDKVVFDRRVEKSVILEISFEHINNNFNGFGELYRSPTIIYITGLSVR